MEMKKALYAMEDYRVTQFTTFDPGTGSKTRFIRPRERSVIFDASGAGTITRLWTTLPGWFWRHWDQTAPVDPLVLRTTIIRLYFDGAQEPSVLAPVGDFFGVGHLEYRQYLSDYLGMSSGGFYCYFPMPFERGFRLEVENLHPQETVEIFFNLSCRLAQRLPEDAGRFHCAFHCAENPGAEPLQIADVAGKGHLAGCALSIQGRDPNYLSFLEAPEFIWIDGEASPAIVGTGMEDFFNGGWYFRNGEFHGPRHGVPLKDLLRSMVSMYRFMDEDRVPFRERLRMAFVNPWDEDRLKPFIFSSTAYYYLREARPACYPLPEYRDLTRVWRVRDSDFQSIP